MDNGEESLDIDEEVMFYIGAEIYSSRFGDGTGRVNDPRNYRVERVAELYFPQNVKHEI